ncbi:ABC transporter permease [Pirellulaceae bacterium SH449]
MSIWDTFRVSFRALLKNKMRASLTVLGVVIGIAAVTTMVSIGQSASALVQNQFMALGTNVIVVFPEAPRRGGVRQALSVTLTSADSREISVQCDAVMAASPVVGTAGQLIYGNTNWSPNEISGVGAEYLTVRNWPIYAGEFFTDEDIKSGAKVCVLGHTVVTKLFQTGNPIGEVIRIRNIPFRIIGVLEKKGVDMVGNDKDNIVLMPYTTVRKRLQGSNFDNVNAILVSAITPDRMKQATKQVEDLLYERHAIKPGQAADFRVQDTTEIAQSLGIITGVLTLMLSAIAGISLLVGGVGIMNIMLVSVTERTKEIGIRMAVGASGGDILRQFLVEAIVLSLIGGFIGVTLGTMASVGATLLINHLNPGQDWPIIISIPAALVALAFAACVGIFFGFYPARRASKMDPIDALRYE